MTHEASDDSILKRIRSRVTAAGSTPGRPAVPAQDQNEPRIALREAARHPLSQMLSQLRATRGLSYEQVRQQTGLPMQLIYDLEYRDRRLTVDELRLLAACYAVSVNDVLGIDLDPCVRVAKGEEHPNPERE